jgi:S1-C subfamily serine protease
MKPTVLLALVLLFAAGPADAQRAKSPADAAVFIRLAGSLHAEIEEFGVRRAVDVDNVELGTGSGFVISPYGYVLTNDHVVSHEQILLTRGFQQITVTLNVSRIDVCFRPGAAATRGLTSCLPASVTASDPELDLAVLFVSGSNTLPYVALGDSDAVVAGLPVDALGYPMGQDVDVAKAAATPNVVPDVSITPGAVSALRADDAGDRRYLQVTNSLNPGNSGGPLVTRDGFAVGVIRMRLANASNIGFAIPVSQVKDFLESRGLDQLMPAQRLRLGPFQSIDAKGVGLRLPEGVADVSPFRPRVDVEPRPLDIALRIDRVLSPWSSKQLEQALLGPQTFETLSMTARDGRASTVSGDPPLLLGGAVGIDPDTSDEFRMEYALLDLGPEKLLARYVGLAEAMAFNESVLRESLAGLQGQRAVAREPVPINRLAWSSSQLSVGDDRVLPVPAGWRAEPAGPSPCPGLPQPGSAIALSPAEDFTFVLRAAVWTATGIVPDAAAAMCSSRRGPLGAGSYASRAEWLGVTYIIEGAFTRRRSGHVVQLEVLSREQSGPAARAVLAAWVKTLTE